VGASGSAAAGEGVGEGTVCCQHRGHLACGEGRMVRMVGESGKERGVSTERTGLQGKNGPESFVSNFQSAVEGEEEWSRATSETRKRSLSDKTVRDKRE
jgi:hypothetical protein